MKGVKEKHWNKLIIYFHKTFCGISKPLLNLQLLLGVLNIIVINFVTLLLTITFNKQNSK